VVARATVGVVAEQYVRDIEVPFGFAVFNVDDGTGIDAFLRVCSEIANNPHVVQGITDSRWQSGFHLLDLVRQIRLETSPTSLNQYGL